MSRRGQAEQIGISKMKTLLLAVVVVAAPLMGLSAGTTAKVQQGVLLRHEGSMDSPSTAASHSPPLPLAICAGGRGRRETFCRRDRAPR